MYKKYIYLHTEDLVQNNECYLVIISCIHLYVKHCTIIIILFSCIQQGSL